MRTRRKMVTVVVYYVEGCYSCGWEAVTAEDSKTEAAQRLREYRDNDPQHAYRMVRRRERTTLTDLPTTVDAPFPPPVDRRRADRRAPDDRPTLRIPSGVCPACRVYQAPADGTSGRCIACDRRIERRIRDRRSAPYRHVPAIDEHPTLPCPPPRKEV